MPPKKRAKTTSSPISGDVSHTPVAQPTTASSSSSRPPTTANESSASTQQSWAKLHKVLANYLQEAGMNKTATTLESESSSLSQDSSSSTQDTSIRNLLLHFQTDMNAVINEVLGNTNVKGFTEEAEENADSILDVESPVRQRPLRKSFLSTLSPVKSRPGLEINAPLDAEMEDVEMNDIVKGKKQEVLEKQKLSMDKSVEIHATREEMEDIMDTFITKTRSQIDASNQREFIDQASVASANEEHAARTNTAKLNRRLQMKASVIHNQEGPLMRSTTKKTGQDMGEEEESSRRKAVLVKDHGAESRLKDLENHLGIDYVVPSPHDTQSLFKSFTIYDRIKVIEQKIMLIERDIPGLARKLFNPPTKPSTSDRTRPQPPPRTIVSKTEPEKGKKVIFTFGTISGPTAPTSSSSSSSISVLPPSALIPTALSHQIQELSSLLKRSMNKGLSTGTSPVIKSGGNKSAEAMSKALLETLQNVLQGKPIPSRSATGTAKDSIPSVSGTAQQPTPGVVKVQVEQGGDGDPVKSINERIESLKRKLLSKNQG